jgi:hypothetical protein
MSPHANLQMRRVIPSVSFAVAFFRCDYSVNVSGYAKRSCGQALISLLSTVEATMGARLAVVVAVNDKNG